MHEVTSHLIEPLVGSDDVVFTLEFFLKTLFDVDVVGLELLKLLSDSFVEVANGNT